MSKKRQVHKCQECGKLITLYDVMKNRGLCSKCLFDVKARAGEI